ncbi:MAG: NYN domain-containing protein [Peptoniphilus sp.]|nr:NYN domain-containing protein [Peptoniphilus sp.]
MKQLRYKKDSEYIFVDGYNIINYWDVFKDFKGELEDRRLKLCDILAEYAHLTHEKIILVFDGYMVKKSSGAIYDYKGIKVIFTKEFETADHFIEKELAEVGRVRRIRVATSDNIEQQIILSRGGSRISAREFEVEVYTVMNKVKKNIQTSNVPTKIVSLDEETLAMLSKLKDKIE